MITTLFKTQFSKILLCIIALGTLQPAYANDKAFGLGFAATTISLAVMNEELAESEWFEKFSKAVNINQDDFAPCLVFGSALWAASYIPVEGNARTILRVGAVLPALAAACLPKKAVNLFAKLPGIKQYFALMRSAKGLPLIGDLAQCQQLGCEGFCHKCKARKLYLTVPLAGIPFIPSLIGSFKATIERWERERIAAANRPHYEALGIPLDSVLGVGVVNNAFAAAARAIHPDKEPIKAEENSPEFDAEKTRRANELDRITRARDALRAFLRTQANARPTTPPTEEVPTEPAQPAPAPQAQMDEEPKLAPLPSDGIDE